MGEWSVVRVKRFAYGGMFLSGSSAIQSMMRNEDDVDAFANVDNLYFFMKKRAMERRIPYDEIPEIGSHEKGTRDGLRHAQLVDDVAAVGFRGHR
jgi:hypothetical protein